MCSRPQLDQLILFALPRNPHQVQYDLPKAPAVFKEAPRPMRLDFCDEIQSLLSGVKREQVAHLLHQLDGIERDRFEG
jgi:hypothetical protein